ncbi:MAG TPA: sigma-70 family RNA polymerase sigma factor [Gemmataceae bacterium]|nr:sigma-70 family RNA polymerase sigma factor [Gemmataceae bacterium]
MTDTPRSLLERLRHQPDDESWKRLVDLYTPLLSRWLRQAGVDGPDADDLVQEVFVAVVREMPSFEHNQRRGAFRRWLRNILLNRVRTYWQSRRTTPEASAPSALLQTLDRLEDPASDLSQLWDREHDAFLAHRLLELIEKDFNPTTWRAFHRVVLEGAKPAEVAAEMGLSVNAVLLAKSRVLRRARQEIDGLID